MASPGGGAFAPETVFPLQQGNILILGEDTLATGVLINATHAVRLLKVSIILTSVQPEVAQTPVGLAVNPVAV